ncbi:prolyl oligopeptidase family serine peptidase [Brevibacterium sp. S111]|uniref:S9 family peptidase n=1 Tax=Brevibacterium sp. S111 TaxID=2483795 RepID=UPI0010811566|nr:prolyl oligopeptidase family serine peptidase [Brevibacterium sp. S111]TGD09217.1 S9 family peptidase [Brevibacterium sp. S111]
MTAPDLDILHRLTDPHSALILPGGESVLFVAARHPLDEPSESQLRVAPLSGGGPSRTLTSGHTDTAPALSPDGMTVAFLRANSGASDLCLMPIDGGDVTVHTSGVAALGAPVFSPDGTTIALSCLVDEASESPRPPLVVDGEPEYKVDGPGWVGTARSRIRLLGVDGENSTDILTDGNSTDPMWSPDGRRLAFVRTRTCTSAGVPAQEIGIVDTDDAAGTLRFPWAADSLAGPLVWTPDGASVIAIGQTVKGIELPRLVRLDLETRTVTMLNEDLDLGVMGGGPGYPGGAPVFGSGSRLYFCVREEGRTVLVSMDLEETNDGGGGAAMLRHPISDTAVISGLDVVGATAVMRISDADRPGELIALDLAAGDVRSVTCFWDEDVPEATFLRPRSMRFPISDGLEVHGWLLRAEATEGPAPTLLDIHGGPHNAWTGVADSAHLYHQVLAAEGWNILTLNPRSSDGYGSRFLRAAEGAWGEADEKDFLEPLDALIADGIVDAERVAVTGYSYGGFMTCWLSSRHPERFTAAVPGGLICDLDLFAATSDMGTHLCEVEFGGQAFDHLSPIHRVDRVTIPTLVLHGQDDQRCPLDQAELWYSRLRGNDVDTRLVIYPQGSHVFILNGPVTYRRDFNQQIIDWVRTHTPAG